jgi:hypothetical protein
MEDALLVLLGTAATLIVGLLGIVTVRRRNGKNHNPNLGSVDEKLTQILLLLTEMKAVMEFCPTLRERRP